MKCITFCSWPFALESVSRRETAVQGQTATTSCRYAAWAKKRLKRESKENETDTDSACENRIREIALKNCKEKGVKKN